MDAAAYMCPTLAELEPIQAYIYKTKTTNIETGNLNLTKQLNFWVKLQPKIQTITKWREGIDDK